jgi:xylan 1,4-beta-xylosidase
MHDAASLIHNPVLPGFHPDPSIVRRGDDYYIATSTFEWFPGIALYHSRDMVHWSIHTHVLTDEERLGVHRLPSAKGIWAPCLTWCDTENLFYILYTRMISHNARFFDQENFLITSPDINGPWSLPVYIGSQGFDPSILHDNDGKKYIVSLEWEFRDGYEKPGFICLQEYDPVSHALLGYAKRIWRGGTDRGCIEGPHLYWHDGRYYLMCAEGGTGYGHCVTMARAESVWGPYEGDPENPILTSSNDFYGRDSDWYLKTEQFNPALLLQKSGHGSLVETQNGLWYLAHLAARPFVPELRCTLGRETALQKMYWTDDGWLRTASGTNRVETDVPAPGLPSVSVPDFPLREDFDGLWNLHLISPRTDWKNWSSLKVRPGWLRLYGQQSLCSLDTVSFIARRLTSLHVVVCTKVEFEPDVWQQSAGLVMYYDNMNWVYLRIYRSDSCCSKALGLMRVENGEKRELPECRIPLVSGTPLFLKCSVEQRELRFFWSTEDCSIDSPDWNVIGPVWDTSLFSDEYCSYGEFTGTFVGLACIDSNRRTAYADFDWFEYHDL